MSVEVSLSGPVFDGSAGRSARRMDEEIRREVAYAAYDRWKSNMNADFRHNGHRYDSFARVYQDARDWIVNDGWGETNDLPYGPWLEGIGSRNSPVTRFPGYHGIKRAAVDTDAKVGEIAQPIVDRHVAEMNGE